ncbi:hypothetical protein BJV78DRAFT_1152130 [Lactifluus subvellereus]|nr:hypothetical protein BJV78DRAFT_1152130 [Lactifluus subvellereus]
MPSRPHARIFQVLVKTHTLTIFLALPNETTILVVKEQVLSAFKDDVFNGIHNVPRILSLDDFVLSREVKERANGTTSYEALTNDQLLRDVVGNWAVLFMQFKDGSGKIQPVEVTVPSLTDDDDDVPCTPSAGIDFAMDEDEAFEESSVRKGKRKAVD